MSPSQPSRRMSAEDAFFLYFEKTHAPLHITTVAIFDGEVPLDVVRENLAADAEFASGKNVTHKEAMRRARSAIGSGRGRTCAVDRGAAPPRRLRRHPSSMRRGESERELDCPISWV